MATAEIFVHKVERICELYTSLFQEVYNGNSPPPLVRSKKRRREESIDSPVSIKRHHHTTTASTTVSNRTIILDRVVVTAEQQLKVLELLAKHLQVNASKGTRFRKAHDVTIPVTPLQDLVITQQHVNANLSSKPECVVCDKKIDKGVYRCKLNVVRRAEMNLGDTHPEDVDLCSTHIYCLPCYIGLLRTVRPGCTPVCVGTCRDKRGGCRQKGKN